MEEMIKAFDKAIGSKYLKSNDSVESIIELMSYLIKQLDVEIKGLKTINATEYTANIVVMNNQYLELFSVLTNYNRAMVELSNKVIL